MTTSNVRLPGGENGELAGSGVSNMLGACYSSRKIYIKKFNRLVDWEQKRRGVSDMTSG